MYYENKQTERPKIGKFLGFDHINIWVGNAKQAATFYVTRMGFSPCAYRGLENGSRDHVSHVVKNGKIIIVLTSPLNNTSEFSKIFAEHHAKHGDGVRDVAFTVENCEQTFKVATERGAKVVQEPTRTEDEHGWTITASVSTYGDTIHSFVQRNEYKGAFLPTFTPTKEDPINTLLGQCEYGFIDHIVGNHGLGDMEPTVQWYEKMLDFHRFWSIDDTIIHTQFSSLNSIVVADYDEVIKMPNNEPAIGKRKSQIQEYVDYYNSSGVQHIAFNINDIIAVITNLKKRGLEFLEVPKSYYDNLRERLKHATITVEEDLNTLEELKILIDYDDQGYLLQIFTKPVEDRPTLFYEFIQRHNHNGFGAGNFRSLFEAIEREQEKRGNL